MVRSNQMSRGASGSISLNSYFNSFVLFIVSRASSEYILERLDGSTYFQFAMPWRLGSLNHRPICSSSSTVTCGPSACIVKRGHTSSTTGSFSAPLPWLGWLLASLTIPGKGRTLTENPPDAGPRTRSRVTPMTLSSMQRSLRRATLSWRTMGTPRARCAISAAFSQRCRMTPG